MKPEAKTFFLASFAGVALAALVYGGGAIAQSPLFADALITRAMLPIGEDETDRNTSDSSVGTTPTEAVTAHPALGLRTSSTVLQYHFTNRDDTDNLCFGDVDWLEESGDIVADGGLFDGGSVNRADCSRLCEQASLTCDGTAATDGSVVLPLQSRSFSYTGDRCVCVVGAAAGVDFSVDRVVR